MTKSESHQLIDVSRRYLLLAALAGNRGVLRPAVLARLRAAMEARARQGELGDTSQTVFKTERKQTMPSSNN